MKKISYQTLKDNGYKGYLLRTAPERVIQFGTGGFLRAFAEDFIDRMNEKADFHSKVVLVQPIPHHSSPNLQDFINEQEGLYTLYLRGTENGQAVEGKRVISCVSRCLNAYSEYEKVLECAGNPELRFVISNTTEAGIVYDPDCRFEDSPAASFPAKLTQLLYHRFQIFKNIPGKGLIILPCELIEDNGRELESCVLRHARDWNLGEAFTRWILEENLFCSTLVDRIVTGYPRSEAERLNSENSFEDQAMDAGELFGSWVIEAPDSLKEEFPCEEAGLPILITDDCRPYRERKVRILNGAHTAMALGAYLSGRDIVRDCMEDPVIRTFMNAVVFREIIPTLTLPEEELKNFAVSVTDRFSNPYIDHSLLSISLNSTSKWKARILPSLTRYMEKFEGRIPPCLCASLALLLSFYHGRELTDQGLSSSRETGDTYLIHDDRTILQFYEAHRDDAPAAYIHAALSSSAFWGLDLTKLPGLEGQVLRDYLLIQREGCHELMRRAAGL